MSLIAGLELCRELLLSREYVLMLWRTVVTLTPGLMYRKPKIIQFASSVAGQQPKSLIRMCKDHVENLSSC